MKPNKTTRGISWTERINQFSLGDEFGSNFAETESLVLDAYKKSLRFGRESKGTYQPLVDLVAFYFLNGKAELAEPYAKKLLAYLQRKTSLIPHPDYALWLNALSNIYRTQGKFDEAERESLEALTLAQKNISGERFSMARFLERLADTYCLQKSYDMAGGGYHRAINDLRTNENAESGQLAQLYEKLAKVLVLKNETREAELTYRTALRLRQTESHPPASELAKCHEKIAQFYFRTGRHLRAAANQAIFIKMSRHSGSFDDSAYREAHKTMANYLLFHLWNQLMADQRSMLGKLMCRALDHWEMYGGPPAEQLLLIANHYANDAEASGKKKEHSQTLKRINAILLGKTTTQLDR